jgi:5-methylcytosine-specific restriction endonuclease McrA
MLLVSRCEAKSAGLSRYFTGKECAHGHLAERFVSSSGCVVCVQQRKVKWSSSEECRAGARRYRVKTAERQAENGRRWRAENLERYRETARAWAEKNQDKIKAKIVRWRSRNREREIALVKAWKAANPEKVKTIWRNNKAKRRGAVGSHTASDVRKIRSAQHNKCAYCKSPLGRGGHLDHIVPIARGGSNWPSNLQWLCQPCNQSKTARDPIEFAQSLGLIL